MPKASTTKGIRSYFRLKVAHHVRMKHIFPVIHWRANGAPAVIKIYLTNKIVTMRKLISVNPIDNRVLDLPAVTVLTEQLFPYSRSG